MRPPGGRRAGRPLKGNASAKAREVRGGVAAPWVSMRKTRYPSAEGERAALAERQQEMGLTTVWPQADDGEAARASPAQPE